MTFAPMLKIKSFVFNDFQENTYIIWDQTLSCAIIDPGCYKTDEQLQLTGFIKEYQLKPALLLNTHCHIDHILGNGFIVDQYKLPLHMHEGEMETYQDTDRWAAMFGMPSFQIPEKRIFIDEGDDLILGDTKLKILFTPGHSVASLSFFHEATHLLISGDVLFKESIGRTDLPGGDYDLLADSIRTKLYTLPDKTTVFSGHGPSTTIGHEKKYNQFVRDFDMS